MMLEYIPVRDLMRSDFAAVSTRMTVDHAASLMMEKDVPCLIVTKRSVPVGSLTERDVLEKVVAANLKPSQTIVKEVMRQGIVTTNPGTDIILAVRKMLRGSSEVIAVVENDKIVGILTKADLIRFSPTMMEISRELAKVKTAEDFGAFDETVPGYCEGCRERSDALVYHDGQYLCRDCRG